MCLDLVSGRQILERGVMPPGEDGRCLPFKNMGRMSAMINSVILC